MATNVIPPAAKEVIGSGAPGLVAKLARAERLASLDAFRGFIMFWIVGGGGLMVGLQALGKKSCPQRRRLRAQPHALAGIAFLRLHLAGVYADDRSFGGALGRPTLARRDPSPAPEPCA